MKLASFPKPHLVLVGVLSLGLCSLVVAKFAEDESDERFTTEAVLLKLPTSTAPDQADAGIDAPSIQDMTPADAVNASTFEVRSAEVGRGDNLALIFQREGIPAVELQRLLASEPFGPRLKRIFPGHEFTFTLDSGSNLVKLSYAPGPFSALEFHRAGDTFVGREVTQSPERTTNYKQAGIDHSLFVASQRAGLTDGLTMNLAQIFQWDIDFVLDIRAGDEFHVIYEELYLGDEFIGPGNILAAEFVNQGERYQALRYVDAAGESGYYSPDGRNMRKAFLRAPVEFSRISSNFNLRRKHPLVNRTMPHRGIDYAAPSGTPILASGDGTVTKASRTKANGNFIVLKHGEQFVTKYLHLSKFARGVRRGARVKQGQVIGYVGATGWATGPHLHYEFLVNGVHKNPRTVNLPDAEPIEETELARFNRKAIAMTSLLENYKAQTRLAYSR
ncbi:MAG: peptidoglycan DD-metalloendopeptidase family protein [Pseudomonadales bacterium]|nr:peptidoglycan DD-metalloendopeptidase family protein [Pseudomonadales bacterium]NIX09347.1 peptidoglycan DD-metalloendopeptidase family protein [Pseudomonadales bacterium]